MSTKIKWICKGSFKYISQIFVAKEKELKIGFPTDVKHLAHIGSDSSNGAAPSWMNEFKGFDMGLSSTWGIDGSRNPTWSSQDFDQNLGQQLSSATLSNFSPTHQPSTPKNKKTKRKKVKSSTSSPKSGSSRSSRTSRPKCILQETDSQQSSLNL